MAYTALQTPHEEAQHETGRFLDDRVLHLYLVSQSAGQFRSSRAIEDHCTGKAWNQAYKAGDIRALDAILDNEIVLINDDGSIQSKAEFLGSVKATGNNSQEQQVAPESMSVHVFGNTAISTGVFRAKGVKNGKSYVRRERFVDTWINKTGKWACVASNATPILH